MRQLDRPDLRGFVPRQKPSEFRLVLKLTRPENHSLERRKAFLPGGWIFLSTRGRILISANATLGILNAALRPKNISSFTEDFRRNGTHYNHSPTVSTALLKAANSIPRLSPPQRTAVKAALGAAQEGGFVLPSDVLASLL